MLDLDVPAKSRALHAETMNPPEKPQRKFECREPMTFPLERWRIDVARWETALRVRQELTEGKRRGWFVEEVYPSTEESIPQAQLRLASLHKELGLLDEKQFFKTKLALEEAVMNAAKDGNRYSSDKEWRVIYGLENQGEWADLVLYVQDMGPGFNPYNVLNPNAQENLLRSNGRGLLLMGFYFATHDQPLRGDVSYLPKHPIDETVTGDVRSNELVIRIRLPGKPSDAAAAFEKWLRENPPAAATQKVWPPDRLPLFDDRATDPLVNGDARS